MSRRSSRRIAVLTAAGLFAAAGLTACGGDGDDTSTNTVAPESVKVPMSEVLAGLPKVVDHANAAASAGNTGDYTTAAAEFEALHEIWLTIEGTIKAADQTAYVSMEDAQG